MLWEARKRAWAEEAELKAETRASGSRILNMRLIRALRR